MLHADLTGPLPSNPAHGPWLRLAAQAVEGDVRMVPEPAAGALLAAGAALLGVLHRRRTRGPRR